MLVLKLLLYGYFMLIAAILLNYLASILKLKGWYDFLKNTKKTSIASYFWLFIAYPLLLGIVIFFIFQIIK
jgi:hypothetical protein